MRYLLSIALCLLASSAWAFPPGFIGAVTQGAGAGGPFLADTFAETSDMEITASTPEVGGAWSGTTNNVQVTAIGDFVEKTTLSTQMYVFNTASPPSSDYSVTVNGKVASTSTTRKVGACGRMSTGPSGYCAYVIAANSTPATLGLYRIDSNVRTLLAESVLTRTHDPGNIYTITLTVNSDSISAIEETDNITISAPGGDSTYATGFAGFTIGDTSAYIYDIIAE